jgi:3-hydroxyacyl-[acyl-carrier-protein] dehydratase
MFLNSLYKIKQINAGDDDSKFSVIIELDPRHVIFEGHFPGKPVLPGACMVQILKELLINVTGHGYMLQNAISIKFISVINPLVQNIICYNIEMTYTENGNISCNTVVSSESVVCCRFKGEFKQLT